MLSSLIFSVTYFILNSEYLDFRKDTEQNSKSVQYAKKKKNHIEYLLGKIISSPNEHRISNGD